MDCEERFVVMRGRLSISPRDADIPVVEPVSTVVAVPVCGAAPGLLQCLRSLGRQRCAPEFGVLLLLQNAGPATLRLVRALSGLLSYQLRTVEIDVMGDESHIGWARRLAMDAAAQWLQDSGNVGGVILTIDADAIVPADWLARNFAALDEGADCVAGGVDYADADGRRLPAAHQRRLRQEAEYGVLLARIRGHFDPAAREASSRSALSSTGSIAVPLIVYRAVGRIAPLAQGAKRAFADSVEATGSKVRYAAGVRVLVPAQTEAPTGLPRSEPVAAAVRRAQWRAKLRQMFEGKQVGDAARWMTNIDIPLDLAEGAADAPNFAAAWRVVEANSPLLQQGPPTPRALPHEIEAARKVVGALAAKEAFRRSAIAPMSDVEVLRASRIIAASAMRLHAQPVAA